MQNHLNDEEVLNIEAFCKNEKMYNAVVKVLLAGLYTHGTPKDGVPSGKLIINGAYSLVSQSVSYPVTDEVLGQTLRGQFAGLNALQNALNELKTIKSTGVESPMKDDFKNSK